MSFEVELKFPLPREDRARLLAEVLRLGGRPAGSVSQSDCYLAHPCRDFGKTHEAFRVRSTGEENCLTYKGPRIDAATKTRRELEVPFAPGAGSAEQLIELFTALGFQTVRSVNKTRESYDLEWQGGPARVELDDVEDLGTFVELETIADQERWAPARDAILALAKELGLSRPEHRSYLGLLLDQQPLNQQQG